MTGQTELRQHTCKSKPVHKAEAENDQRPPWMKSTGAEILDGYELERLPITEQVSRFAMRHATDAIAERNSVPPDIEADTTQVAQARARVGAAAYALNVQQFACAGLNYGYFYPGSPIIHYDDEPAPDQVLGDPVEDRTKRFLARVIAAGRLS
jgi:hypothetical protein